MATKILAYWDSWKSSNSIILYLNTTDELANQRTNRYNERGLTYQQFLEVASNHSATYCAYGITSSFVSYLRNTLKIEHILNLSDYITIGISRKLYVNQNSYYEFNAYQNTMNFIARYYGSSISAYIGIDKNASVATFLAYPSDDSSGLGYITVGTGYWDRSDYARSVVWNFEGSAANIERIHNFYRDSEKFNPTDDPYVDPSNPPSDDEDPEGGDGNHDGTSDQIPDPGPSIIPELEQHSAVSSGFVTLYNPNSSQLDALYSYLWSPAYDPTSIKKLFNDGMSAILGLHTIPVQPQVSAAQTIYVGDQASTASAPRITNQYVSHDFGSMDILEYWGCYLDYNPYTTIELYLPYIGYVHIDPDDFMGTAMHIRYTIDVLSGELVATITAHSQVIMQIQGSCAAQIPLTASDHSETLRGAISAALAGMAAISVISGGGNWASNDGGVSYTQQSMSGSQKAIAAGAGASSAKSIMSMKERYQHSGGVAGSAGHLGVRYPYIIYRRARQSLAAGQNAFTGYPSNMTKMVSNCSGFTKVDEINLIAPSATEPETEEILAILKSGVII